MAHRIQPPSLTHSFHASLLEALDGFAAKLESLVVDSNRLCSQQSALPLLPALTTLCVNDNAIDDLDAWLRCLSAKCPALTYLSMLKNPACPNFFTGKDQQDYARYRLYVLHCLPGLKFLDSSPITPAERAEAKRVGHLMRVARPTSAESLPSVTPTEATPGQLLEPDAQPEEASKEDEEDPLAPRRGKASFGVSRYIYQGKQSEGNRFITNDEL